MSNYTKSTNFTAKDSLPTGDTNKVIRGSEFDTEFDAIQTAVGTKSDLASPTFTGTATFANLTATGTVNFTGGSVTTNIDGGTIDGVTIGGATPGAGTFSSLTATTADINAGTVDNTVIGGATPAAGTFSSLTATTADINGGNIDGTVIGASSTAAISGTTGTFSGAVTGSNLNVSNWDTAFSWGNHGTQGYLTSVTFSDIDAGAVTLSSETFVDSDTQIPTNAAVIDYVAATIPLITEVNDLTASVTWANVPDANITQSSVTQHQAALSINTSQISGGLSLTDITDVTATATEVNVLDGITATTTELNYTDGVTSNIQTQIDSKMGSTHTGNVSITGDVDVTGEMLADSYNETFKQVSNSTTTINYDLSSASYESKTFSFNTQDTAPRSIAFNSDGTKIYMVGTGTDTVYQYSLSTAYDVSTTSYDSVSFSVASEESTPQGIAFKPDGTKMYIVGTNGDEVNQYSLSTAFDLSTASFDSVTFSVSSEEISPTDITFNNNGTKFYIVGSSGDEVNQYSLSTAYDMSTASFDSVTFDLSGATSTPTGIAFNSDGTRMFITSNGGNILDSVIQYTLSTAFDISTASFDDIVLDTSSQEAFPEGVIFNNDGSKIYVVGSTGDSVFQYSSTATENTTTIDCENANVFQTTLSANTTVVFSNPPVLGTNTTTFYDISRAVYRSNTYSTANEEGTPTDVKFNNDGTKMYVIGQTGDEINEYNLTTAFDVTTASAKRTASFSGQDTSPQGLAWKPDGTKYFMIGNTNDTVYAYNASIPFSVLGASYASQSFSVNAQETIPTALTFKPDGTKMFVCGTNGDDVNEYSLSTAWDVSTATFTQVFDTGTVATAPSGLEFNSDGTRLYISCSNTDKVHEFSLSTAYDVSTISTTGAQFSLSGTGSLTPAGLTFNSDGSKMFIVDSGTEIVYEFLTKTVDVSAGTAYAFSLKIKNASSGTSYSITWPSSINWVGGLAPALTTGANKVDQLVFYTYDGGNNWYGFVAGQDIY